MVIIKKKKLVFLRDIVVVVDALCQNKTIFNFENIIYI